MRNVFVQFCRKITSCAAFSLEKLFIRNTFLPSLYCYVVDVLFCCSFLRFYVWLRVDKIKIKLHNCLFRIRLINNVYTERKYLSLANDGEPWYKLLCEDMMNTLNIFRYVAEQQCVYRLTRRFSSSSSLGLGYCCKTFANNKHKKCCV